MWLRRFLFETWLGDKLLALLERWTGLGLVVLELEPAKRPWTTPTLRWLEGMRR